MLTKRKKRPWCWFAEMLAAAVAGPIVFLVSEAMFPFIRDQLVIIPGVFVGALVILCTTRWLNLRDYRHHVGRQISVWHWIAAVTCIFLLLALIAPAIQKAAVSQ